ncbi:MAG: hypothetical protein LBU82_06690 [Treponema sp.]|jgi:hypothetical protein|nr:hypothetical protein [Treponema sp.]
MSNVGGITDTDKGMQNIMRQISALSQLFVKAGIVEGSGEVDGLLIAQYAAWNEFGVPGKGKKKWRIPPRPFIRGFVENEREKINETIERLFKQVSEGKMSAKVAIRKLGEFAQTGIQKYIITGNFTPNAERTIRRKKRSRPLIDTETMRDAVRYQIGGGAN